MLAHAAANVIRENHEILQEGLRPTVAFAEAMYHGNRPEDEDFEVPYVPHGFSVEIENYVGQSALSRPFGAQQMTVAQAFFKERYPEHYRDPDPYMEVNRSLMNVWLFNLVRRANTETELHDAYAAFTDCQNERGKLSWESFLDLKQKCRETFQTPEEEQLFVASLIYADMGKSKKVLDYMETKYNRKFADHDELVAVVMENEDDIAFCMPSFLHFSEGEQKIMIDLFKSGFHLPQFQLAENLPRHLVKFQKLSQKTQAFGLLNGLFDIGGAVGDRVQNGSGSLDERTYQIFLKAWGAIFSRPDPNMQPNPTDEEIALHSYRTYLAARAEEWGFDVSTREGWAFTRLGCMMRSLRIDEVRGIPEIYHHYMGRPSQAVLLDVLNSTGFEKIGGALWFQYYPALLLAIFNDMKLSGVPYQDRMVHALTTTARISTAVRHVMDVTGSPVTTINIGDMVRVIEKGHWKRLLTQRVVVIPTAANEAKAMLQRVPTVKAGLGSAALREVGKPKLVVPAGQSLYIAAEGHDVYFERFASDLGGAQNVARVSLRSDVGEVRQAEQIGERSFVVSPSTQLPGSRNPEGIAAGHGDLTYLIKTEGEAVPEEELSLIAEHAEETNGAITSVVVGDVGGKVLLPHQPGVPNRAHNVLAATAPLESRLHARSVQRGLSELIARTVVFIPGAEYPISDDSADFSLQAMASRAGAIAHNISQYAERYLQTMRADGLPNDSAHQFSSSLSTMERVLQAGLQNSPRFAIEPLDIPVAAAMRRTGAHVPYATLHQSMQYALVMNNARLRAAVTNQGPK